MVTLEVPEEGEPMTVRVDGRRRLRVVPAPGTAPGTAPAPATGDAGQAAAARFPRAAVAIDALSVCASAAVAALLLLPLSRAKLLRQLPRAALPAGAGAGGAAAAAAAVAAAAPPALLAGARPSIAEQGARLAANSLLPPPFSALAAHCAAVPLQAAVVRAQAGRAAAGAAAAATRSLPPTTTVPGFLRTWASHAVRDVPFSLVEAYTMASLLVAVAKQRSQPPRDRQAAAPLTRRSAYPQAADTVVAGSVAGLCTVPLDFFRTRLLVSARPSLRRTVAATARLIQRRGAKSLLAPNGATLYVTECMLRPVAFLSVYVVCRAALMASWIEIHERQARREKVIDKVIIQ